MKATRICSFPDCGAKRVAQGLCAGHRAQLKKGRDLTPIDRTPRPEFCTFPGCGARNYVRGLCRGHGDQEDRGASLTPIVRHAPTCTVDGCDRKHASLGYCALHYARTRRNGDPHSLLCIPDAQERFDLYVEKTDTCWLWIGSRTHDGYGLFGADNRRTGAHRFSYEFHVGPIPDGLQLDHLCYVRNCVNPAHLEPVTAAENGRRARVWAAARRRAGA